jgi:hypothetical protein
MTVKWFVVILLTAVMLVAAQSGCNVVEFYQIGYTIHDPTERHRALLKWLQDNGGRCNKEQFVNIWNNLPDWAGTADTPELRQTVITLYNRTIEREAK